MKTGFRILTLTIVCLIIGRYVTFSRPVNDAARTMDVVAQIDFHRQISKWVGQQVRMQGVITSSLYLPGIGFYSLADSSGHRVNIICNHYPPSEGQIIDVVLYVQPMFKLESTVTLQFEIETIEVILSQTAL